MLEESSTDERKEKTAEEMAEYKKRYAQEQKERNQINQSLLALKVRILFVVLVVMCLQCRIQFLIFNF